MSDLWIDGEVADQLRELAQYEGRSVEAMLKALMERYSEQGSVPDLARLAHTLAAPEFRSGHSDTATRSREILETEYAENLARRTRDDASR